MDEHCHHTAILTFILRKLYIHPDGLEAICPWHVATNLFHYELYGTSTLRGHSANRFFKYG